MSNSNYQGALQQPINSGFNGSSTSMEVIKGIDLTGKIAIVTGGYAGIGLETVKALTSAGATVIVPARDVEKAKKNLEGISNVELETMDLMDPVSIDSFAEKFMSSERPLHLLINNAGIMWVPLQRDSRGYESQLSTNHLGHFQLTSRLWKALVKAEGARVINVSSWGHHYSKFNFEDPNFEKREYESLLGYGQSKTANILFSVELDNRGKDYGVRAYSLHPGAIVETDLKRHLTDEQLSGLGVYDENGDVIRDALKGLKTISQGASTTVWVSTSPDLNEIGGVYCENNNIADVDHTIDESPENFADRMTDIKKLSGVLDYALDEASAKDLWLLSEDLTGVKFII
ncbi:SDR family NAD(P)-dependent oxidoreductase [Chryseobacterium caseinilyticum]|uniref:SDR family NAD(P)-dependent oxidoreductase n=1 Tax=Chryseobacterium caseinilyticum TaxID=2771428 RepID=A0ABR8ZC61_9FLAO|nr:SDR family NAD(P)-dependent oxidoreductase [Chryseobacterium caseinilyticum]MBD8082831.1 SDR family NAD(P)-dependent oxidoreductase [Chryseobacterium caseinilyticum]